MKNSSKRTPLAIICLALLALLIVFVRGSKEFTTGKPALSEVFADDFLVGVAVNRYIVAAEYENKTPFRSVWPKSVDRDLGLVKEQYNQISPENVLKWQEVHPQEGESGYDFGHADAFVQFGLDYDMYLIGHALVWHEQVPAWVFRGSGANGLATREELLERMREHIHTVVGRYKGKIKAWDVVNEALAQEGEDVLRNTRWLEIIGSDYIAKAFEFAHEADPDAILRYNDFGLEKPEVRKNLITLIKSLQEQGVPVHVIGTQSHLKVTTASFERMDQALTEMKALGLPIHVTELDIDTALSRQPDFEAGIADGRNTSQDGLVANAEQLQTEAYRGVFRAFLKHKESIGMVTFWGVNDASAWRSDGRPLLFDGEDKPKPAFDAILGLVNEK